MADANQLRDRICTGFKRYYESQGKEYDRIFTIFCEENGYDDDEMIEGEMGDEVELEDCPLTDFDADFPVPKGQNKEEFIYTLIQKIIDDPDITFDDDSFITCMFTNKNMIIRYLIRYHYIYSR